MAAASSRKARPPKSSNRARRWRVPARAAWRTRSFPSCGKTQIPSRRCCNDACLLAGGADRIAEIRPHEELLPVHDSVPADVLLLLRAGDAANFAEQLDGALPDRRLRRVRHHGLDAVC